MPFAPDDRHVMVRLSPVDEPTLVALTALATSDASADEVTPPLTHGSSWTPERIVWFEDYHRRCRDGLTHGDEQTWVVVVDGSPTGAVRLKRVGAGALECGIWLARSFRGQGVGRAAMRELVQVARTSGAKELRADTAEDNTGAQALMRGAGLELATGNDRRVHGRLTLN